MKSPISPLDCRSCQMQSKESGGCLPFPNTSTCLSCLLTANTSEDNLNMATEDSCTGKLLWPSNENSDLVGYEQPLGLSTQNSQDQAEQESMSGKKIPESQEPSSNWGSAHSDGMNEQTGMQSRSPLFPEIYRPYPQMFLYVATTNCEELARITYNRLLWSETCQFSGGRLVLANREEHGMKREWKLTLKIRTRNSGVVTEITNMLSLMNFEEVSQFPISFGGWIATRSSWKSRVEHRCCQPHIFG